MALDFLWKRVVFLKSQVFFFGRWNIYHIYIYLFFWKVKVFWWLASTKSSLSRWWCHQKLLVFVGVEPIWQIICRCFETTNWYVHWKNMIFWYGRIYLHRVTFKVEALNMCFYEVIAIVYGIYQYKVLARWPQLRQFHNANEMQEHPEISCKLVGNDS